MPLKETELAINLRTLVDLEPLVAAMPNLKHLELSNVLLGSLVPLSRLNHLELLILSEANIEDITPLSTLSSLVHLDLRGNIIQDLSPLAGARHLKQLDVRENRIQNFRVLSQLPSLFSVRLGGNPIDTNTCPGQWADACEVD